MTRKVLLVAKVLSCQLCDRWSSRKTASARCQEERTAHKGLFCFYLPSWKQHPPGEFIKGWHHLTQFGVRERKYSAQELSLLAFALCLIFYLVRSNRSLCAHFTAKRKRLPGRVCTSVLSFSDARVRLNSSPSGNGRIRPWMQRRSDSQAGRHQSPVSRWMSGSLSGACRRI